MNKLFHLALVAIAILAVTSCRKLVSYEDVPMDPADSASVMTLLSTNNIVMPPDSFKVRIVKSSSGKVGEINLAGLKLTSFKAPFSEPVLPACIRLSLADNAITKVEGDLRNFQALAYLHIDGNALQEMPEAIRDMTKLKTLTAAGNHMTAVSSGLGTNLEVTYLDLGRNQLKGIPAVISGMKKMVHLDLRDNQISTLDSAVFCSSTTLQTVILVDNEISTMPSCDYGQSDLRALDISRNKITEFPQAILGSKVLRALIAGHNSIRSLPDSIGTLTSLEKLLLEKNELRTLPQGITDLSKLLLNDHIGGLDIDSNRLCNLSDSLKAWVETYVKRGGQRGAWRNTQTCD